MTYRFAHLPASLVLTLFACAALPAVAEAAGLNGFQPLSTGVVYPGFNGAIQLDAAALSMEQGSALAFQYGAPSGVSGSTVYQADYAYASGSWGLGLGYAASQSTLAQDGVLLLGTGFKVADIGLGLSMPRPMSSTSLIPELDLSLQIGRGDGIQFGADLSGLPSTISSMTLGVGYREKGKYSIEGGVRMPWLTQVFAPSSNPVLYLGAGIFPGAFGASFGVTSPLSKLSPGFESLGIHWAASQKVSLLARWNSSAPGLGGSLLTSTSPGAFTLGVTLTLG